MSESLIEVLESLEKIGLRTSEEALINLIRMKMGLPSGFKSRDSLARKIAEELQVDLNGDFYDWRLEEDLEAQVLRIAETIQRYQERIAELEGKLKSSGQDV